MKKVTTGLLLAVVLIALWALQGPVLRVFMACMVLLAVFEIVHSLDIGGVRLVKWVPIAYAALSMPAYVFLGLEAMFPYTLIFIMLGLSAVVLRGQPDLQALSATVLPIVYPGAMLTLLYPLQDIEDPYLATVAIGLAFISAFFCDIFAWAVGKAIGKKPLCPALSPKKTVEGAVAGLVGAAVAAPVCLLASGVIVRLTRGTTYGLRAPSILALMAVSVVAGAFSQLGDLTASLIKRHLGIKDYSNFLPGHGGVMDRLDSVIFTSVIIYTFFIYGMQVGLL